MKKILALIITLALVFAPLSVQAQAAYYVSAIGNDANAGTLAAPFKTIAKAVNVSSSGDAIYLRAGTYPAFTVTKSNITIQNYNDEAAVISGGGDVVKLLNVSGVTIRGLQVMGGTGNYGAGIRVTGGAGNIIEGNEVHHNAGRNTIGIFIEDTSNNKVLGNKVHNNYLSGIEVISHGGAVTGNEIIGNEVFNNTAMGDSDGIKMEGAGTKNTLVKNNVVYGNSDDGIDTWNSTQNTIIGNVSYGHTGTGDGNGFKLGNGGGNLVIQNISYGNKASGFDSNGAGNTYYNNVAYNNGNYGFEDGWKQASCTVATCVATLINNIGYNNAKGNLSAGEFTTVSHNNLWYSDSGGAKVQYDYRTYSTLEAFYVASGNRLDNPLLSKQVNPRFTNAAIYDFSLLANSPAIGAGDPSLPAGIADIGAIPYAVITPTPTVIPTPTGAKIIMKGIARFATNIKSMTAGVGTIATLPVGGWVYGEVVSTDLINFDHYYTQQGVRVELGQLCKAYRANLTLSDESEPVTPPTPEPDPEPISLEDFDLIRQVREGVPNSSGGVDWGAWRYEGVVLMDELP